MNIHIYIYTCILPYRLCGRALRQKLLWFHLFPFQTQGLFEDLNSLPHTTVCVCVCVCITCSSKLISFMNSFSLSISLQYRSTPSLSISICVLHIRYIRIYSLYIYVYIRYIRIYSPYTYIFAIYVYTYIVNEHIRIWLTATPSSENIHL